MIDSTLTSTFLTDAAEERIEPLQTLIKIIDSKLPKGFEARMAGKMISWEVPLSTYPNGYHCTPNTPLPFLSLANQKGFIALYHMGLYANQELYDWFVAEYPKNAKYKLDMGKSCIRFKRMNDIPFNLIGELLQKMTPKDWIDLYEKSYQGK